MATIKRLKRRLTIADLLLATRSFAVSANFLSNRFGLILRMGPALRVVAGREAGAVRAVDAVSR